MSNRNSIAWLALALIPATAVAAEDDWDLDAIAQSAGFIDYFEVHQFCHAPTIRPDWRSRCVAWEAAMEREREVRRAPERKRLEEAMQRMEAAKEAERQRAVAEEAERQRATAVEEAERKRAALAQGRIAGEVLPGDGPEYVRLQWGEPKRVRRAVSGYGVDEWWFYGGAYAVHFVNGVAETVHTGW